MLAIDILRWPGMNQAFIFSFVLTLAMALVIIPIGKRRPVDRKATWGEAIFGATYVFAVMFVAFGVVPHQWIDHADKNLGWRKDKIIAINTHMITAFLDRYVRGDESRASYLDGLTPRIDDTVWPADLAPRFDMTSTASAPVTLWKGFKRRFATGLELRAAPASP